jgi:hypothetical protein
MDLTVILQYVEHLGSVGAVIFFFLFMRAEGERKETTKQLLELVPETIKAIQDGKAAVDLLRVAMGTRPNGGSAG